MNYKEDWKNKTGRLLQNGNYNELLVIINEQLRMYMFNSSIMDGDVRLKVEEELELRLVDIIEEIRLIDKPSPEQQHCLNWLELVTNNKYRLFISCFPNKTVKNSPDSINNIVGELYLESTIKGNAYANIINFYFKKSNVLEVNTSLNDDKNSMRIRTQEAHMMIQLIENRSLENSKVQFSNYISDYRVFLGHQNIYPNKYLCFCVEKVDVSGLNGKYNEWVNKIKSADNAILSDLEPEKFKERVIDVIEREVEDALYPKYIEYSDCISNDDSITIIKVKVRRLIGNTKIGAALKALEEIDDENIGDEAVRLRNRYNSNEKDLKAGNIDRKEYRVEKNQIVDAILYLLHQHLEEYKSTR